MQLSSSDQFVEKVCLAVENDSPTLWLESMETFFTQGSFSLSEWQSAEQRLLNKGIDYFSFCAEKTEQTIASGMNLYPVLTKVADCTRLTGFRFLSALSALNNDDLSSCVDECDKVDAPFAAIYTLQGQAFLEMGRIEDAVETLKSAVTIDKDDLLARFQLVKAYIASDKNELAWKELIDLDKLEKNNIEIAVLCSHVADVLDDTDKLEYAFIKLSTHLDHFSENSEVIYTLLILAIHLESEKYFESVVLAAKWDELKKDFEFVKRVPEILRALDKLAWFSSTRHFLDMMVQEKV